MWSADAVTTFLTADLAVCSSDMASKAGASLEDQSTAKQLRFSLCGSSASRNKLSRNRPPTPDAPAFTFSKCLISSAPNHRHSCLQHTRSWLRAWHPRHWYILSFNFNGACQLQEITRCTKLLCTSVCGSRSSGCAVSAPPSPPERYRFCRTV